MGTRCLTTVVDGNKELVCMYRQFDGYPEGHGAELVEAFKGYRLTNGISGDPQRTANGVGCLAAQVVAHFKMAGDGSTHKAGNMTVGGFYLYAPETREVGEEFIYTLSERDSRIWLTLTEGEVAFFGMPGTKPELMEFIYLGYLDDFNPKANHGLQYHSNKVA